MAVYVILRRGGWRTSDEVCEALKRSSAEAEWLSIDWLHSYVLAELDGSLGTVCVCDAPSPEAVRLHGYRAGLPVDEIVGVADTVVASGEPLLAGSGRRSPSKTREGGSPCS